MRFKTSSSRPRAEQISLFLGEHYVLTFHERNDESVNPVRERLRQGAGRRIRKSGPDYLTYALIDAVIDLLFPLLERFGDRLDEMEQKILTEPDTSVLEDLNILRKDILGRRSAVWPKREAINLLIRNSGHLVTDDTRTYLRDCYDHTIQLIDLIDNLREIASGQIDLYISTVSNRMNEVMKVLTIMATIFIPLSFIAGVYGMNFDAQASPWNMPELGRPFGYPLLLLGMLLVAATQLFIFWRKGWIGRISRKEKME